MLGRMPSPAMTSHFFLLLLPLVVGELSASFEKPDTSNLRTTGTMFAKNCQDTRGSALFFFSGGSLSTRALKPASGDGVHRYRVLGGRFNLAKSGVSMTVTRILS